MAKKKKGLLPKVEILIIFVFFFSFIIWAVSRCNATKHSYEDKELALEGEPSDSTNAEGEISAETMQEKTSTSAPPSGSSKQDDPTTNPGRPLPQYTTLYVTIDELNMRTGPSLDSAIIIRLPLFEEVSFMNEVTDFKETLSLGKEIANEPWVKIKSKKGHIGWVYGAGVHYYKEKRSGVIE